MSTDWKDEKRQTVSNSPSNSFNQSGVAFNQPGILFGGSNAPTVWTDEPRENIS